MTTIIIYTAAGVLLGVGAFLGCRKRWRNGSTITPLDIYAYLSSVEGCRGSGVLLRHRPTKRERKYLTETIVELRRTLLECRAERAGELSRAWGLEGWLERRVERTIGAPREEALEWLLLLHPTATCAEHIWGMRLQTRNSILLRALIAIYAKPSQVAFYLKALPYTLTWSEVERVVAVLQMRSPILTPPKVEGVAGCNVEMLVLYLAHVEGVGEALYEAARLTDSSNRSLRAAAYNVLLGEARFPRPRGEDTTVTP